MCLLEADYIKAGSSSLQVFNNAFLVMGYKNGNTRVSNKIITFTYIIRCLINIKNPYIEIIYTTYLLKFDS